MTKTKLITWVSAGWVVISLILVGLFAAGALAKDVFSWSFAGGFIVYAILATLINNIDFSMFQKADTEDSEAPEDQ